MSRVLITLFCSSRRSGYVLLVLLIVYLLNQLDRYTIAVTSEQMAQSIHFGDKGCMAVNNSYRRYKEFCRYRNGPDGLLERSERRCLNKTKENATVCRFDYDGTGLQYQILAGPAFILVYTLSGVPLGLLGNYIPRKYLLAICLLIWSGATIFTGLAKTYWELLLTRFITGIGEAGCTPFATSLLGDYFSEELRGAALGVYNWGIYFGYSLSYALGNYITQLNINGQGWRWAFFIAGMPGILMTVLILATVKEPRRRVSYGDRKEVKEEPRKLLFKETLTLMLKAFFRPSSMILFLAGTLRNAGGYVWAYNTQPYFNLYHPNVNVGNYMSWIPLIGGSLGVVLGGLISDKIVVRRGPYARVWVLVISQITAAPFAAGALYLNPPWAFISLIPSTIIGEMWIGVTLAVVIEITPSVVRTACIAWYLFVITIIGGNVPLLVPVLSHVTSLRTALYILFPGLYAASSVVFLLALFVLKWDLSSRARVDGKYLSSTEHSSPSYDESDPLLGPQKVS